MHKIDTHKKKYDVMCLGRIVLDIYMYPTVRKDLKGNFYTADNVSCFIGGTAANTAFVLNKLSAKTVIAGAVGSDIFGNELIQKMNKNKLFSRNICKLNTHTSVSFITLDNNSEPIFIHTQGANQYFTPSEVNMNALKQSKYLHIGGVFLLPEFDNGEVKKLIKFARTQGTKISADTTHNLSHPHLLHNYNGLDIMFMNYEEACAVTDTKSIKRISACLKSKFNFETVVIKLGKKGCAVISDSGHKLYKGNDINPVDQCGAGDAFVAGFLYGAMNEWNEAKTAEFANACGAQTCLHIGPTNEAFTKEAVIKNLNLKDFK